ARGAVKLLAISARDAEPTVRVAAVRALARIGWPSAEALAALKVAGQAKEADVRGAAADALRDIFANVNAAAPGAAELVAAALKAPEARVRLAAAQGLGQGGWSAPVVLAGLKAAAEDKAPDVRRAAAEALE